MRCSRTKTQPTDARGHVDRVLTVCAISMKYSSQPGRIEIVLRNAETIGQLPDATSQRLGTGARLDVGQRVAHDARDLPAILGAETARRNRRRSDADAACNHRLLFVERNRVLIDGDSDFV